jgi:hypothetical protein
VPFLPDPLLPLVSIPILQQTISSANDESTVQRKHFYYLCLE